MRMLKPLVVGGVATILAFAIGFQLSLLGSMLPVLALAIPFAAAIAMAAAVLLQRPALATTATGLLLLSYGLVVAGRSGSILAISTVGLVAGGTFLTLQLGGWAVELRTPAHEDQPAILREAARVTTAAVAVAVAAESALLFAQVQVGTGVAMVSIGVVSLAGIVIVAAVLAGSTASSSTSGTAVGGSGWEAPVPFGVSRGPGPRIVGWIRRVTVGSPLSPAQRRSTQSMAVTSGLSLLLLAVAALVVLSALSSAAHPTSSVPGAVRSVDIATVVELGILLLGAIVLNWLVRLLLQLARPHVGGFPPVPRPSDSREAPPELQLISHACRSVSLDSRVTGDLQLMLAALADQLGEPSLSGGPSRSLSSDPTTDFPPPAPTVRRGVPRHHPGGGARETEPWSELSVRTSLEILESAIHG